MARKLAVFDMDGVLIPPRSSWRVVHERLGTMNEVGYGLYMEGAIDDEEFMRRDIALWRRAMPGIDVRFLDGLFREVPLMDGFEEAMGDLSRSGFDLMMVSGGLSGMARRVDGKGRFSTVFVNDLATDDHGRLTGEGILVVPLRDKGSVLKGFLDTSGHDTVAAIGDSLVDVSMFRHSDLSIAFRPMDEIASNSADLVIERPDLREVAGAILERLDRR